MLYQHIMASELTSYSWWLVIFFYTIFQLKLAFVGIVWSYHCNLPTTVSGRDRFPGQCFWWYRDHQKWLRILCAVIFWGDKLPSVLCNCLIILYQQWLQVPEKVAHMAKMKGVVGVISFFSHVLDSSDYLCNSYSEVVLYQSLSETALCLRVSVCTRFLGRKCCLSWGDQIHTKSMV